MKPKITLVTVCYQAEKTIKRTLLSVLEQTYPDIEYLIVDGASQDHTLDIVRAICSHAIVISEPDRGIYDAMNKAIDHATGDYIWFLNAGDVLDSEFTVQRVVEDCLERGNTPETWPDVLYGDTRILDDEGHDLGPRRLRPPKQLTWRSFRNGMLVCHQAFIPKRALVQHYHLRYRFSSDFDWCIRVLRKAKTIVNTDRNLVGYLNEGITTRNHRASLWERFGIMCRYYGILSTIFRHIKFIFIRNR